MGANHLWTFLMVPVFLSLSAFEATEIASSGRNGETSVSFLPMSTTDRLDVAGTSALADEVELARVSQAAQQPARLF